MKPSEKMAQFCTDSEAVAVFSRAQFVAIVSEVAALEAEVERLKRELDAAELRAFVAERHLDRDE